MLIHSKPSDSYRLFMNAKWDFIEANWEWLHIHFPILLCLGNSYYFLQQYSFHRHVLPMNLFKMGWMPSCIKVNTQNALYRTHLICVNITGIWTISMIGPCGRSKTTQATNNRVRNVVHTFTLIKREKSQLLPKLVDLSRWWDLEEMTCA